MPCCLYKKKSDNAALMKTDLMRSPTSLVGRPQGGLRPVAAPLQPTAATREDRPEPAEPLIIVRESSKLSS